MTDSKLQRESPRLHHHEPNRLDNSQRSSPAHPVYHPPIRQRTVSSARIEPAARVSSDYGRN
ncbi:hypothetical protein BDV09DRAFT_118485 [Aspergillus tetrazonus]